MEPKISAGDFALELQAMAQSFYDRTLADETVLLYFDELCMYEMPVIHAALRKHLNSPGDCKWFPKPGQLKAYIEPSAQECASTAWANMDILIRTRGRYQSVSIEDEIAAEVVVSMGGWINLCSSANDREHEFKRNDFIKRYENLKNRVRLEPPKPVAKFTGMVEQARLQVSAGLDSNQRLISK